MTILRINTAKGRPPDGGVVLEVTQPGAGEEAAAADVQEAQNGEALQQRRQLRIADAAIGTQVCEHAPSHGVVKLQAGQHWNAGEAAGGNTAQTINTMLKANQAYLTECSAAADQAVWE